MKEEAYERAVELQEDICKLKKLHGHMMAISTGGYVLKLIKGDDRHGDYVNIGGLIKERVINAINSAADELMKELQEEFEKL